MLSRSGDSDSKQVGCCWRPSGPREGEDPVSSPFLQVEVVIDQTDPSSGPSASNSGPLLAGAAIATGIGLFALSVSTSGPSFASLEEDAVPLDVALANGKPTLVEFYAG